MTAVKADRTVKTDERVIVALDVETAAAAKELVSELDGLIATFKVGLQLFCSAGPDLVRELTEQGKKIFLDLKFHDIPNTAAKASVEAARCGAWMFNLHASGGREMMKRAAGEVSEFCEVNSIRRPYVIAVTVLTSMGNDDAKEVGCEGQIAARVVRLARLAGSCGLDGVVASAAEAGVIREAITDPDFRIVTPGIRLDSGTNDDQKRVMAPRAALDAGADHLVIGRPIIAAADRRTAAARIVDELNCHL